MIYELKKFEEKFNDLLQPDPGKSSLQNAAESLNWITRERERICLVFKEIIPGKAHEIIKTYFFHHQQSIVFLSDRIYSRINELKSCEKQLPGQLSDLQEMLKALEGILIFMETDLQPYFNPDGKVPDNCIELHQTSQKENHHYILQALEDKHTDPSLSDILFSLLRFKNRHPDFPITFNQFNWVQHLQHHLLLYLENPAEDEKDLRLIRLLISTNLNTVEFYWYCCQGLQEELTGELTVAEQYKKLASLKKRLNQYPKLQVQGYLHEQPSIKNSLLKFIKAEIKSLKELEFIAQDLVNSGMLASNFKVSLSAKQLAFYIYLNVECGIIITEQPKKLHEFIITHVDSAQKRGLSLKSFKNNYYSHAPADVKKVEERLAGMLALIREKYW
jgi:hypothetical protein